MTVSERLREAGLLLPDAPKPQGAYVPAIRAGGLVFTSGQLPLLGGELMERGSVGDAVSTRRARECAAQAALNALAAASTVADLDELASVAKLVCYVASEVGFFSQPAVADGASAVITCAFGQNGLHAREAVGVASLPMEAPVELSLILVL